MYIYKITNNLNGRAYIGQTKGKPENRWKAHCSKSGKPSLIGDVIRKFGKENFTFEVIHTCELKQDLDRMEAYYIQRYKTYQPYGYNLTKGNRKKLEGPLNKGVYQAKMEEIASDPNLDRLDRLALTSAISLHKSGTSLETIVKNFNKMGLKTSRGMVWSIQRLRGLAEDYGLEFN